MCVCVRVRVCVCVCVSVCVFVCLCLCVCLSLLVTSYQSALGVVFIRPAAAAVRSSVPQRVCVCVCVCACDNKADSAGRDRRSARRRSHYRLTFAADASDNNSVP